MSSRLSSLDVFRGLTMVLMLLVNNIALDTDTPAQLMHAAFGDGVHAADLVFPWFLLIVGVALPFAAAAFYDRGGTLRQWRGKAAQRALNLFLLGCLIDISTYKVFAVYMDVLQLIGLAYWAASFFYDLPWSRRTGLMVFLLLWHAALVRFIPAPGQVAGLVSEDHNILTYIDQTFLVPVRLWGLVAVVPTTALVLIGTLAGDVLRGDQPPAVKVNWLLRGALLCGVAGMIVNLSIPYSKVLWTSSYILLCGGLGIGVLAALYAAVDWHHHPQPFFALKVLGMNAMAVYVVPILIKLHTLQEWTYRLRDGSKVPLQDAIMNACYHHLGRYAGGWFYTLAYIGTCWLLAGLMYRKRIFWRV